MCRCVVRYSLQVMLLRWYSHVTLCAFVFWKVSAHVACAYACSATLLVPPSSLSKYGGKCTHGKLATELARKRDNHCGCCDPGYFLVDTTCMRESGRALVIAS